jgi:very-short-patch-repair endonuclease
MPNFEPKPTKQVLMLVEALKQRGVILEVEKWDGHKHIDIYIPNDNLYIEVDGVPHATNVKQIIADFNRDYFSFKEGFFTKHITNELIEAHLDKIADAIAQVAKNAPNKIGENLKKLI